MGNRQIQRPYDIVHGIADDIRQITTISLDEDVPTTVPSDAIIDSNLFEDTRGYLKKLVYQINSSYSNSCYDACALLIRKLIELLIEDIYETHGRVSEIVNPHSNQLFGLGQLITTLMSDSHWKLNRYVEDGLDLIKTQGDKSAHNRRYNARKSDVDKVKPFLRDISEELLYLRLSQVLCKPPAWCRIEAPYRRF